ncbi:MAG: hypothetical protein E7585_05305 [Ruminococcaceae bacterium]|nr:hypothetical protein [Oscillospiraceae bacterium]
MAQAFFKKGLLALVLACVMIIAPLALVSCKDGQDGTNGIDGKDGKDGTAWITGTDDPTGAQGKDGDFYFDMDSYALYQKKDGLWKILQNNFGKPGINGTNGINGTTPTVTINGNGYWVINGTATTVKATGTNGTTPTVTINNSGYWVINGTPTGVKAKALDITIGATAPTNPQMNDLFLNNNTWELFQYNGTTWVSKGRIGGEQEGEEVEDKVVDLVIFMGQSNMAGRGVAAEAPTVGEGHGYEFRAVSDPTKLYPITEPFGVNENRGVISETTKTGSLVSAFAESYYAYTGVPIVGVSASQGGKKIEFWATNGDALNETITRYNAAKTYLTNNGYTVRHQYMVWLQGETDGAQGTATAIYKNSLVTLFGEMKKQGVEKAMVIRIGDRQASETQHDAIILAQTELCREHDDFVMISGKLAGVAGADMKDSAHFKQSTYNEVGADAGKNMAYYVNTGMEPYFWDPEYNNYYPFGGSGGNSSTPPAETVTNLVIDVSDPNSTYNFSDLGTVSGGKVTVSENHTDKYLAVADTVILSDDYSWTCEFIAGGFTGTGGVIACSGTNGAGFINLPYRYADISLTSAGFRFRDEGNTFQIDMTLPANYDNTALHHFALVYDATTRTFKAYIDYVECKIVYNKGTAGGFFTDTQLNRVLGGYPTESNAKCDFAYFAFTKTALVTDEMKQMSGSNA